VHYLLERVLKEFVLLCYEAAGTTGWHWKGVSPYRGLHWWLQHNGAVRLNYSFESKHPEKEQSVRDVNHEHFVFIIKHKPPAIFLTIAPQYHSIHGQSHNNAVQDCRTNSGCREHPDQSL